MQESYTYTAFISYSHRDKAFATWLHRQLESYRIPKNLIGQKTLHGIVPDKLGRLFRDQDELAVTDDLTNEVHKAIASSKFMVVLCSPASAASRWVNKEVIEFKKLRGDKYVLPLIIDGEPFAAKKGRPKEECFPPAVRFKLGADGLLSPKELEPSAADIRKSADGRQRAFLKLVAGILGVGLDELVERDLRRKQRRVMMITAGSVVAMLVMGVLTIEAVTARKSADRNRGEAEDLIEFMLTDLHDKLEPVGRLDALDVVGEKVLDYYENQARHEVVSDDSIGRKSRAYHLLGDLQMKRDKFDDAVELFRRSAKATEDLLKRDPHNTRRIFEHAQSVFWLGERSFNMRDFPTMEKAFWEYKRLADRLVELEPDNLEWQIEEAYGNLNVGAAIFYNQHPKKACPYYEKALVGFYKAYGQQPENEGLLRDIINTQAKIYDCMYGHVSMRELNMRTKLFKYNVSDLFLRGQESRFALEWATVQKSQEVSMLIDTGRLDFALTAIDAAIKSADDWLKIEPDAAHAFRLKVLCLIKKAAVGLQLNRLSEAEFFLNQSKTMINGKLDRAPWWINMHLYHQTLLIRLEQLQSGNTIPPQSIEQLAESFYENLHILKETPLGRETFSLFTLMYVESLIKAGNTSLALQERNRFWQLIDGDNRDQSPALLRNLAAISRLTGDLASYTEIQEILLGRGFVGVETNKTSEPSNRKGV